MIKNLTLSMLTASALMAQGDMLTIEQQTAPKAEVETIVLIKAIDGYVRTGYQRDENKHTDAGIAGKFQIETNSWNGILVGASFYTSHVTSGNNDGTDIPFFNEKNNSYNILGEAYLLAEMGHTSVKVGRQELETPFINSHNVGMIPNTFEAAVVANNYIPDTTLILAYVTKMAGLDSEVIGKFTDIAEDGGIRTVGINYEGITGLSINAWYYNLPDTILQNITYLDAKVETSIRGLTFSLEGQVASLDYDNLDTASVFGARVSSSFDRIGMTVSAAYNKVDDNLADNGFGAGPYYTYMDLLSLEDVGEDSYATLLSAAWDTSILGLEDLTFSVDKLTLTNIDNVKSEQTQFGLEYNLPNNLSLSAKYSEINLNGEKSENTRVFVNYTF